MEDLNFEDLDNYLLNQNGKIIHQIWFGTIPDKRAARKAFEGLRKYRDSWLVNNPTWTYVCWNLDKCKALVNLDGHNPCRYVHLDGHNHLVYHLCNLDENRYRHRSDLE